MGNQIARPDAFPAPDERVLGDAMLQLTEGQRKFVVAYLEDPMDEQRAAFKAGFGTNIESAHVSASRMMHNPSIIAAIREEADRRLRSGAILGASVIVEIAKDAKHKDRFKAADRLLGAAGLIVEQTHRVIHEDHRTDAELERAIAALAIKFNLDPKKLLGQAVPIEGVFEEVVHDAEGLEDIL